MRSIVSHCCRRSTTSIPETTCPEHRVAPVEVRLRRVRDEELAAAGVRPVERHADGAAQYGRWLISSRIV
jgi:hypothetical protein